MAETLISREVIFTDDVEHIFGPRQWVSRTDEILKAREQKEKDSTPPPPPVMDVEATEVSSETPPPPPAGMINGAPKEFPADEPVDSADTPPQPDSDSATDNPKTDQPDNNPKQ